jgi:PAT family beta-lactamase induction signal transducer AmpG|tara:strand:+ start:3001 stop:4320 length:1320 start_codon:yes stop_codon:yes gene_type:complete
MNWFLTDSRYLRLASFTIFYIGQGIPIGLISIALPIWLAAQEVSGVDIALFVSITGLPWGLKLFAGPIMDRYTFLAMGRRRPWIIAAQTGLVLAMLGLALVPDPANNFTVLTVMAFCVNCFAAVQDVAIDGMAIDVLPEDEHGQANAFMAFGQVAGFALSGALSATALVMFGLLGAGLISAGFTVFVFFWGVFVRERRGEKIMPWTGGKASASLEALQAKNWSEIFINLGRTLILPASLMLIFVSLCLSVASGVSGVAVTLIAIQDLGYDSADFSYLISACSFVAALLSLALGPLIDQYGAKRFLMIGLIGNGLGLLLAGVFTDLWSNIYFCIAFIVIGAFLSQCTFISFIALHMKVCWLKVAATQFAIYMAWSNLGKSIGAGLYSQIKPGLYQGQEFILIGVLSLIGAAVLVLVNMRDHKQRIEKLDVDGGIADAVRV